MGRARSDIRVGTSGWHYHHWIKRFYPADLPKSQWFTHYAQHFDTVEINNTFYRLPKDTSVKRWRHQAPAGFVFAVKANRFITHIKRLRDVAEPLQRFCETVELLGEHLGPVLYQLPPGLHKDLELLRQFLKLLDKKRTSVFEFRHESWFCPHVFEMLHRAGAGFCVHDMPGRPTPRVVTGRVIYVRFHGASGRYEGNYTPAQLRDWARWIGDNRAAARNVYAYFNNDYNAYAVYNAQTLRDLLLNK